MNRLTRYGRLVGRAHHWGEVRGRIKVERGGVLPLAVTRRMVGGGCYSHEGGNRRFEGRETKVDAGLLKLRLKLAAREAVVSMERPRWQRLTS